MQYSKISFRILYHFQKYNWSFELELGWTSAQSVGEKVVEYVDFKTTLTQRVFWIWH